MYFKSTKMNFNKIFNKIDKFYNDIKIIKLKITNKMNLLTYL